MTSPQNQKSKRGIKVLNELKLNNQNIKRIDSKDKDDIESENNEVNLQTANNNVKLLLTGFINNLVKEDSGEYKNILQNFRQKINTNSITLDEGNPLDKNFKNSVIGFNRKNLRRKSKRKISLYTQMPKKYNLNIKILENIKPEKQDNTDINRTYSNLSNDISNEELVKKKKQSSNSISITKSLFKKGILSPKRSSKHLNSYNNLFKSINDNEYDNEEKLQKSNRTQKTNKSNKSKFSQDVKSQKSKKTNQLNKKPTFISINKKKSSLFQLYKKPEVFNNTNNNNNNNNYEDFNEIEFDKNSKRIVNVMNSPINSEIQRARNKISNTKISFKSQKGNSSISSNNFSLITNDEHLNSDSESELNIANIRGLSKRNVQEINDIRIKLKDNMIGKKISKVKIKKLDSKKNQKTIFLLNL